MSLLTASFQSVSNILNAYKKLENGFFQLTSLVQNIFNTLKLDNSLLNLMKEDKAKLANKTADTANLSADTAKPIIQDVNNNDSKPCKSSEPEPCSSKPEPAYPFANPSSAI